MTASTPPAIHYRAWGNYTIGDCLAAALANDDLAHGKVDTLSQVLAWYRTQDQWVDDKPDPTPQAFDSNMIEGWTGIAPTFEGSNTASRGQLRYELQGKPDTVAILGLPGGPGVYYSGGWGVQPRQAWANSNEFALTGVTKAQAQSPWIQPHAVFVLGTNESGIEVVSWGMKWTVTWAYWARYGTELWRINR